MISALAIANIVGVRVTATVTNALTVGKLAPLLFVAVVGLFFVDPQRYALAPPPDFGSFSQAALLLVFAYTGFEGASIPTGEMRDPARHLPFALLTGMGVAALVYVLIQTVCIGTLPELAASERPLLDASVRFLGPPAAPLVAAAALLSICGTMNAAMFVTPRLLFAMGENRQLPHAFVSTHARFHTPIVAILLTAMVSLVFTLFSTFISALTFSAVIRLMAYTTTCAALPILRRNPHVRRPAFVAPAGGLISMVAIALSVWLLSNSSWNEARLAGIAVGVGFVLYLPCARASREAQSVAEEA
jgi:basic amino acid/polyamine antiporter, APA family